MLRSEMYKLFRMHASLILFAVVFVSLLLINILLSGIIDGVYITSYDNTASVSFENMFMSTMTFLQATYALPLLIIIITAASFSEEMQNKTIYHSILAAKSRIHLFITKTAAVIFLISALIACALITGIILYMVLVENNIYGVPIHNVNIIDVLSFILVYLLNNIFIVSITILFCITVPNGTKSIIGSFISIIILNILKNVESIKRFLPSYLGDASVFIYKGIIGYEFMNIGLFVLYILAACAVSVWLFNKADL